MSAVTWNNSRLAQKSIGKEVTALKRQPGKEIIIYGSGTIVSALTKLGLIDEYRMWVHPVVIGKGKPLFTRLHNLLNLELYNTKAFQNGVVILYYAIKK